MKDNLTPKTTTNRTLTSLVVFLSAVMFGGSLWGCYHTRVEVPERLIGKYISTHPEYEDEFFEIDSGLITMAVGGGMYKYYKVKKVENELIENRNLYTILCANEDEGEEFNFSFFAYFNDGVIIHFKNKQHVVWEKQKTKISHQSHPEIHFQH